MSTRPKKAEKRSFVQRKALGDLGSKKIGGAFLSTFAKKEVTIQTWRALVRLGMIRTHDRQPVTPKSFVFITDKGRAEIGLPPIKSTKPVCICRDLAEEFIVSMPRRGDHFTDCLAYAGGAE